MKQYNKVRTVPTKWLEYLPSHWDCKKIGLLFSERKTKVSDKEYAPLSVTKIGVVSQLESAVKTDAGDNRKLVCKGDFVINSRSDRKGSCGISNRDGSVSLINIVLKPRDEWNRKYVHYMMRCHLFSEEFYHYGRGIVADLWTTRFSEMKNIFLPIPPRAEQDQIVRFLDWKVSEINKLIKIKCQEIENIVALKRTLISNTVIHGLDSNISMKDSGVKWIGEIPEHWIVVPLCSLAKQKSICNYDELQLLSVYLDEGIIPFSQKSEKRTNITSKDLSKYQRVDPGDFVLNNQQAWRGSVGVSFYTGIVSPAYIVLKMNDCLDSKYANYLLRSRCMVDQYFVNSKGVGSIQRNIYWPSLRRSCVPVPPRQEQEQIVRYLEQQEVEYNKSVAILNEEIVALAELRSTLISNVVTGKIDVRDIVVPDYEYVDEEVDAVEENVPEVNNDEEV